MATTTWEPTEDCQCGRGCTRDQRLTAERKARDLARSLGEGWVPRVWDNLGWHVAASALGGYIEKDGLTVYAPDHKERDYTVMGDRSVLGSGRTPLAAVRRAHAEVRWRMRALDRLSISLYAVVAQARS